MPVKGRLPLLKITVSKLIKQGYDVICAGHTDEEKDICLNAGAIFIKVATTTHLGHKWQICLNEARKLNPEAVMIMGSSDMVQDGWGEILLKDLEGYAMAGTQGIYFLDIGKYNKKRMLWWAGYTNYRKGETIGTGRLVSKKALDLLDWKLFNTSLDKGIDYSMMQNLDRVKKHFKELIYCHKDLKALSISTYQWENLHSFDMEARDSSSTRVTPDEVINKYFPEVSNVFNESELDKPKRQKIVPYTVNVGEYDKQRNDILCFSQYNRFKNNVRNSRIYFALPHLFINCEISILVSCEVIVKVPYEKLVKEWLGDADMAFFKHPWRDCVHEEIIAAEHRVKAINDPVELDTLRAQGDHYREIGVPEHLNNLPETAIWIRRHNKKVEAFNNALWAEMCRWSYRDQTCIPKVLLDFPDLKVNFIEPDVRVHPYTEIGTHIK